MLVDDHPSVLVAFGRLLQECCEVIATVATGSEAIEAARRLKPDVLVVDLMLPDLDGLEVCRRVKNATPETDVVIVTAFADAQVETVALQCGASAFVSKHWASQTLVPTILGIRAARHGIP